MSEQASMPKLTALQFLTLGALVDGEEVPGRELRSYLNLRGAKASGPQFYQLMSRLEKSGYVTGYYADKVIQHQTVSERRYLITGHGSTSWEQTRAFYGQHSEGKGMFSA